MSRENVEFDDFRDANKCAEKFLKKAALFLRRRHKRFVFLAQFCMVFWLSCLKISKLREKRSGRSWGGHF